MAVIAAEFRQASLNDERQSKGNPPVESRRAEEDFHRVFTENWQRIVSVLRRIVGDPGRAEDLAIETFWRFHSRMDLYADGGNPGGWLYRTATRLGIDCLRAEARRGRYEQQAGSLLSQAPTASPLAEALRAETQSQVRRILASLPPGQAQLLILRSYGFSYLELSEALGVKRSSVGAMLIRAEDRFRRHYQRSFGKQEEP